MTAAAPLTTFARPAGTSGALRAPHLAARGRLAPPRPTTSGPRQGRPLYVRAQSLRSLDVSLPPATAHAAQLERLLHVDAPAAAPAVSLAPHTALAQDVQQSPQVLAHSRNGAPDELTCGKGVCVEHQQNPAQHPQPPASAPLAAASTSSEEASASSSSVTFIGRLFDLLPISPRTRGIVMLNLLVLLVASNWVSSPDGRAAAAALALLAICLPVLLLAPAAPGALAACWLASPATGLHQSNSLPTLVCAAIELCPTLLLLAAVAAVCSPRPNLHISPCPVRPQVVVKDVGATFDPFGFAFLRFAVAAAAFAPFMKVGGAVLRQLTPWPDGAYRSSA